MPPIRKTLYSFLLVPVIIWSQPDYGIAVMGTDAISGDSLYADIGKSLDSLLLLHDSDTEKYELEKGALEVSLKESNNFAYTHINVFKSYTNAIDIIIDVVEKKDSSSRLNFRPIQNLIFKDPDGLLQKWQAYANTSFRLFKAGEITNMACPVAHCTWSFNHPELASFFDCFETYVNPNKGLLIEILNKSMSADQREAAAFLLAHADHTPQQLIDVLTPSIEDPSSKVRNASLRVIYYVARNISAIEIPVDQVINALNYPSFTDRNKALVILRSIPLQNLTKKQLQRIIPKLIEILKKQDAHNYRNAYTVIKNISQENYALDDLKSWEKWMNSVID